MANESGYIELAYSSIPVFLDDGSIDMEELNFLMGIALRDEKIDDDEKRVLKSIFEQLSEDKVSARVKERVEAIRRKYDI